MASDTNLLQSTGLREFGSNLVSKPLETDQNSGLVAGGVIDNFQNPNPVIPSSNVSGELSRNITTTLAEAERTTPLPAQRAALSAAIGEPLQK